MQSVDGRTNEETNLISTSDRKGTSQLFISSDVSTTALSLEPSISVSFSFYFFITDFPSSSLQLLAASEKRNTDFFVYNEEESRVKARERKTKRCTQRQNNFSCKISRRLKS
mmetsp:Transcript_25489/g.49858  ORF Transcript_25489/g.49858 Transcript_25489/m.49858 type:complete len:112 (+) Transcript_25489:86-421(+)